MQPPGIVRRADIIRKSQCSREVKIEQATSINFWSEKSMRLKKQRMSLTAID